MNNKKHFWKTIIYEYSNIYEELNILNEYNYSPNSISLKNIILETLKPFKYKYSEFIHIDYFLIEFYKYKNGKLIDKIIKKIYKKNVINYLNFSDEIFFTFDYFFNFKIKEPSFYKSINIELEYLNHIHFFKSLDELKESNYLLNINPKIIDRNNIKSISIFLTKNIFRENNIKKKIIKEFILELPFKV